MKEQSYKSMNVSEFKADDWLGLSWQPWRSLNPADGNLGEITQQPGLYRVRHQERDGLTYIGQTGRNLRERLRALAGWYEEQMSYTDPHVAAPVLVGSPKRVWAHLRGVSHHA